MVGTGGDAGVGIGLARAKAGEGLRVIHGPWLELEHGPGL